MNTRKAGGRLRMTVAEDRNVTLVEYRKWLAEYRSLSEVTIRKYLRYLALFLEWLGRRRNASPLLSLSHDQVETFFLHYSSTRGAASREQMQAALRVFLGFCSSKGYTRDLTDAVPTVRSFTLAKVPRAVSDADIERILAHINRSTSIGRRDYAMIQMFHEYGVRSKQVRMLRLCDIDWKRSEIRFPIMKYGKEVRMPLTPVVGESLCDYLQHGQPRSPRQEVFLSARPPFRPFRHPSMITRIVLSRAVAAGITSHTVGPHQFRHAFATRMLNDGRSLKTIADLLGHRRLQTAFIYTKVDFQNLSAVALEWPEGRS